MIDFGLIQSVHLIRLIHCYVIEWLRWTVHRPGVCRHVIGGRIEVEEERETDRRRLNAINCYMKQFEEEEEAEERKKELPSGRRPQ